MVAYCLLGCLVLISCVVVLWWFVCLGVVILVFWCCWWLGFGLGSVLFGLVVVLGVSGFRFGLIVSGWTLDLLLAFGLVLVGFLLLCWLLCLLGFVDLGLFCGVWFLLVCVFDFMVVLLMFGLFEWWFV